MTNGTTATTAIANEAPANGQTFMGAAKRLAPRIRELAPSIERDRRLPEDLVRDLKDAGLFHLLLPRSLGGHEIDPVTTARIIEEVSRADGATGWCLMIAAQNAGFAGFIPEDAARTIWADGSVVCGSARPIGRAVATPGTPGYVVSGRWPFASGCSHATWFAAECMVYDGEQPSLNAEGDHASRMLFVHRDNVTLHETWDTLGLRGTASNDFSIDSAYVPEERGFQMLVTPAQHPWRLYKTMPLLFINHGSQSLGIARAAIDTAAQVIAGKKGWGNVPLAEISAVQIAVASATALVDSAASYLYETSQALWDADEADLDDAMLRAKVRLATSHAAKASEQAVDIIQNALATSAIFTTNPLERYFRDIHTAKAHVMIGSMTYEAAGRVLLGLDARFPFF